MARSQGLIPDPKRVRELERFYGLMGKRIERALLDFNVDTYSEIRAISLEKEIKFNINKMNVFAVKWSGAANPEAYKVANKIAGISLGILGKKKDPIFNSNIHRQTVDEAIDITDDVLIRANNSIKFNIGTYINLIRLSVNSVSQIQSFGDLRDEEIISKLLDDTIKAGGTRGDLKRLIRIHFDREIREQKYININGRNYNLISYAENVARTRLRTIQSRGVKNTCLEYDNDLIKISDHGSEFIDICLEFEGNTYSINGKTPGYERLVSWPPFHNQCEHSAAPTSIEAIEARRTM